MLVCCGVANEEQAGARRGRANFGRPAHQTPRAVFVGLPAIWWAARVGRDDDKSLGKMTGGTAPARIWRSFMASALAVDGRRGPPLPRDYSRRSLPEPEPERQSPLPEDWGEQAIRRIVETVDELVNGR